MGGTPVHTNIQFFLKKKYSKTCFKQPLKKDKTKVLITNGSLKQVESIAECSEHTAIFFTRIKG